MRRGPELLHSDHLKRLIAHLSEEYPVIIVDSPPLAVGVDPCVLATVTGKLLLVLRPGVTDLELAETKLEVLDSLPVSMVGAVLNDVRPGGAYKYYTYDVDGYEVIDDEETVVRDEFRRTMLRDHV